LLLLSYRYVLDPDTGKPIVVMSLRVWVPSIEDDQTIFLIKALGVLQCITSTMILIQFAVVMVRPAYMKLQNPVRVVIETDIGYYVVYMLLAVLGSIGENWLLLTLHLLDIIKRNPTAADVVRAVTFPIKALMQTVRLMVFVVFIMSTILFLYWPADFDGFDPGTCNHLLTCWMGTIRQGLTHTGGVGDVLHQYWSSESMWVGRMLYFDIMNFYVVNIILMNVIFGIIIDTFSELRAEKNVQQLDIQNVCFICNIHRNDFERIGVDMRKHRSDHWMWNYLKYMTYIWLKPADDTNGLEDYVSLCMKQKKIDWFPINRARDLIAEGLEEGVLEGDELDNAIHASVHDTEKQLHTMVEEMDALANGIKVHASETDGLRHTLKSVKDTLEEIFKETARRGA